MELNKNKITKANCYNRKNLHFVSVELSCALFFVSVELSSAKASDDESNSKNNKINIYIQGYVMQIIILFIHSVIII